MFESRGLTADTACSSRGYALDITFSERTCRIADCLANSARGSGGSLADTTSCITDAFAERAAAHGICAWQRSAHASPPLPPPSKL